MKKKIFHFSQQLSNSKENTLKDKMTTPIQVIEIKNYKGNKEH